MYKNRWKRIQLTSKVGSKLQDPLMTEPAEKKDFEVSVGKVERLISLIESDTTKMEAFKHDFKTAKDQKVANEITTRMHKTVKVNNENTAELKRELEHLGKSIEGLKKEESSSNSASSRSVILKYGNLIDRVSTVLNTSRLAQDEFKIVARNTINRHINIINKDLSEAEKQEINLNPEKLQNLLAQKLNYNVSTNLINTVSDIENKYKDILSLEKTINECLQLMQDLAILVDFQGEQLNRIEFALIDAHEYVKEGETKLVDAKKHYKAGNKKICWIVMLVVFALGVILVPVLLTQLK